MKGRGKPKDLKTGSEENPRTSQMGSEENPRTSQMGSEENPSTSRVEESEENLKILQQGANKTREPRWWRRTQELAGGFHTRAVAV